MASPLSNQTNASAGGVTLHPHVSKLVTRLHNIRGYLLRKSRNTQSTFFGARDNLINSTKAIAGGAGIGLEKESNIAPSLKLGFGKSTVTRDAIIDQRDINIQNRFQALQDELDLLEHDLYNIEVEHERETVFEGNIAGGTIKEVSKSKSKTSRPKQVISLKDTAEYNAAVDEVVKKYDLEDKIALNNAPGRLNKVPRLLPKVVHFQGDEEIDVHDNVAQTDAIHTETSTENRPTELSEDQEWFNFFNKKGINKMCKSAKHVKAYTKLVTYLKFKSFLKHRDTSLIQLLTQQAQTWMIKEGYKLQDPLEYTTMANAVTVAFLISEEEMKFRQIIKRKSNFDNMGYLNKTVRGELGKVFQVNLMPEVVGDLFGKIGRKQLKLDNTKLAV